MYTGKGIGVAVLDTGIFPHIDFGSRISVFRDFTGVRRSPYDDNGHGTHVSGILAGDGTASGGKYKGAAPGCSIAALKVLDRFGNGSREDVMRHFGGSWSLEAFIISVSLIFQWEQHPGIIRNRQIFLKEWKNFGIWDLWW